MHTASLNWQQRIRREERASSKSTYNVLNALDSQDDGPFHGRHHSLAMTGYYGNSFGKSPSKGDILVGTSSNDLLGNPILLEENSPNFGSMTLNNFKSSDSKPMLTAGLGNAQHMKSNASIIKLQDQNDNSKNTKTPKKRNITNVTAMQPKIDPIEDVVKPHRVIGGTGFQLKKNSVQ